MSPDDRIAELEEEVAYLRSELGLSRDLTALAALDEAFGLRGNNANLLMILYAAYPRTLSKAQLFDAMAHDEDGSSMKMVDVYVCRVRKRLGHPAIMTHWGVGFSLGTGVRERLSALLSPLKAAA